MMPKYASTALQSEDVLSVHLEWTSLGEGTKRTPRAIAKPR